MVTERVRRWAFFLASAALLAGAVLLLSWREYTQCLGLDYGRREPAAPYEYRDYSQGLLFMGQKAAIDLESSTIYIAQALGPGTQPHQLTGKLTLKDSGKRMYFAEDPAFSDLQSAVAQGHCFPLIIEDRNSFMRYNVVFTTLPVLCMEDPERTELQVKGEGDYVVGEIRVWNPRDTDAGGYSVRRSDLSWHLRGNYMMGRPKKNYKLNLLKPNGAPRNLPLMGLGEDDDWILNGMFMDDTKVKEKLLMTLWNELAQSTDWDEQMSTGAYGELIVNGSYRGLHLVQRRVDSRLLKLKDNQILIKAVGGFDPMPEGTFEVIESPISDEETLEMWMELIRSGELAERIDVRNYADISLFLQLGSMNDNCGYRNLFFLLTPEGEAYRVGLILWDTDQAMGVTLRFRFDLETSVQDVVERVEFEAVREANPEFWELLCGRWRQLRQELLSQEHIEAVLHSIEEELLASGCLARDTARWGQAYDGQESMETLRRYLARRLAFLDAYYGG